MFVCVMPSVLMRSMQILLNAAEQGNSTRETGNKLISQGLASLISRDAKYGDHFQRESLTNRYRSFGKSQICFPRGNQNYYNSRFQGILVRCDG